MTNNLSSYLFNGNLGVFRPELKNEISVLRELRGKTLCAKHAYIQTDGRTDRQTDRQTDCVPHRQAWITVYYSVTKM